jgi:hypothetical protein
MLGLVRCSRHIRMVLESQLDRRLDRLYVVTHLDEHWAQVQRLPVSDIPNQPEQRVLHALFGEANLRGNFRAYCFVEADGQSVFMLTQWRHGSPPYYISGKTESARDHFASWLQRRCEQQLAIEAHAYSTGVMGGVTSDV